ncbi:MAG: TIGR03643 family protein [Verrucomicrobiota bacterium]|nr:TIGR03643 family protein [Verrucomicrobiota bacterium]
MPPKGTQDWIIWAAWADRITFEEIFEISGKNESDVIRLMRSNLKPSSFRKWRARASKVSHKHKKLFRTLRENL